MKTATNSHHAGAGWRILFIFVSLVHSANAQPLETAGRIGIELSTNDGPFIVQGVIANMPAQKAGIRPGDKIVEVAGKSTAGMSQTQVVNLLRGAPDTKVKITVESDGKKKKITLERSYRSLEQYEADEEDFFERFKAEAKAWRSLPVKPVLPEETKKQRILAENAVQEHRLNDAKNYYRAGLQAAGQLWPEGNFNTAMLCAELGNQRAGLPSASQSPYAEEPKPAQAAVDYRDAVNFMRTYLELLPDAPDAQQAREKIIIWEEKVRLLKEKCGVVYVR